MTKDEFWHIIDLCARQAKHEGLDAIKNPDLRQRRRAQCLAAQLTRLPVNDIVSFQAWFECMIDKANTAKLQAAHMLLTDMDGSDDGYLYFRTWLVGQGREFYEAAIRDPNTIADVLDPQRNPIDQTEAELLRYAATNACETLTGLRDDDESWPLAYDTVNALSKEYARQLPPLAAGDSIDSADIPRHLPKLAVNCEQAWSRQPRRPRNAILERQPDGSFVLKYRK